MQNIPPAMVLSRFLFYPANKRKIGKHFIVSFASKFSKFNIQHNKGKTLPDFLVWEHLGEQSIEHRQLQSSHVQAISGKSG